jgi:hypothetical protein
MTFVLTTSASYYNKKDADCLKKYGFTFNLEPKIELRDGKRTASYWHRIKLPWRKVENTTIEIATLEDLMRFQAEIKNKLIIHGHEIEIYDDCRE